MQSSRPPRHDTVLPRLERRLNEAFDELRDHFVDPAEAYDGANNTRWLGLDENVAHGTSGVPFANESQLRDIRSQCRMLAVSNEYAINGHENRISYAIGTGHAYRAIARPGAEVSCELVSDVQAVLQEFLKTSRWYQRQQEIVRRRDRDGEAFLRFFTSADGTLRVRFVEPGQVASPTNRSIDPAASFGILTDRDDVETPHAFCIDGHWVDASEIQHRKANVDVNVKRGLPLFYPVRKNLRRAEKLLRNMSVVSEIQSAIAIIRKHGSASRGTVQQFVQDQADASVTSPTTGETSHFRRYAPGTILDAFAGTEYEFPVAGIDAANFVTVLRAELRAIAARLVMPEFMFSSDASNAAYASTMVAEGPAVRMFERLQQEMIEDDLEVMRRVVESVVGAGRLSAAALKDVDIRAIPPTLAVRDRLKETQADQILVRAGAMSKQTMSLRHGLDPETETSTKKLG